MTDELESIEPAEPKAPASSEDKGDVILEVHPPTAAIHGWRDFFIHIATITIGLLIAIGLEQTVEYVHHLDQLRTVRQELAAELDETRRIATMNEAEFVRVSAELDKDMRILRTGRNEDHPELSRLDYGWKFYRTPDGAWQAAKQNGALILVPHDELHKYVYDYAVFAAFMDALTSTNVAMEVANAIAHRAPNDSLSKRDIEELISATSDSQGKLAFAAKLLGFEKIGLGMPARTY